MGARRDSSGGDTIPTTRSSISRSEAVVEIGLFSVLVCAFNVFPWNAFLAFTLPLHRLPSNRFVRFLCLIQQNARVSRCCERLYRRSETARGTCAVLVLVNLTSKWRRATVLRS